MVETVARHSGTTRQDYENLPEGPPFYELIRGELIEMTRSMEHHHELGLLLAEQWRAFLRAHGGGSVSWEPNLYLPDVEDVLHPDLAYVAAGRDIRRKRGIVGVPDVVCEILSPSTERRDRGVKFELYQAARVTHLWLVDPDRPVRVEEYTLGQDGYYRRTATVDAPAEWQPLAFPGWTVALSQLDAAVAPLEE